MAVLSIEQALIAIIIGLLVAIVFCLKFLFRLERRLLRIDQNIAAMVNQVLAEEHKIEEQLSQQRKATSKKKPSKKRKARSRTKKSKR